MVAVPGEEGNRFDFLGPVGQEGSPGGSVIKNLPVNAMGEMVGGFSIPEWGRSPGEGNGNPLQYSCLGKSHEQMSLV